MNTGVPESDLQDAEPDFHGMNRLGYDAMAVGNHEFDKPLAVLIQSTSAAGKSTLMDALLALMPESERVHYSAMTGQSLFYLGETSMKHKILAIAEEEGVRFDWLAAPKAITGGASPSVKAVRMRLGVRDASGRAAPEEVDGSDYALPSDLVIAALGFAAVVAYLRALP